MQNRFVIYYYSAVELMCSCVKTTLNFVNLDLENLEKTWNFILKSPDNPAISHWGCPTGLLSGLSACVCSWCASCCSFMVRSVRLPLCRSSISVHMRCWCGCPIRKCPIRSWGVFYSKLGVFHSILGVFHSRLPYLRLGCPI